MKILQYIRVPTGAILVVEGDNGYKYEVVSMGDYGKEYNLKCDSMGLSRDIEKVVHVKQLPLEEKWVISLSTQTSCKSNCIFCDVPKVSKVCMNASLEDLVGQVMQCIKLHPEVKSTKRLNIHYARMGEPTWNPNVITSANWFKNNLHHTYRIHPVVSTMLPNKNKLLRQFITMWMHFKNVTMEGEAGLQFSINSTSDTERNKMFSNNTLSLEKISELMYDIVPVGRKITLNFAVAGYEIDPDILLRYFDPDKYIVKLTPMHKTNEAIKNSILTAGDYTTFEPYKEYEDALKRAGYDVLVFIASKEEDEGMITCGNVILGGNLPKSEYSVII
jgi:23S rRNA (adenine2503-C2)-methyltransferase